MQLILVTRKEEVHMYDISEFGLETPWGIAYEYEILTHGIAWVKTPSHSALIVEKRVAAKLLSERALACGFEWGDDYVFEEDKASAAFVYEQPQVYAAFLNNAENCTHPTT